MRVRALVQGGLVCLVACSFATVGLGSEAPLADAAMNGDAAAVRQLLSGGAAINATHADGTTALHWAAHRGDVESAELLLASGADVEAATRMGVTPLYVAAVSGNARMLNVLLAAGADPEAALTAERETALMFAAAAGDQEAVRTVLDHGGNVHARQARGQTALMWAAAEGHAAVIRSLIERGADPNAATLAADRQERLPAGGMTPLLFAAREGHLGAVEALLDGGADADQTRADGTSPLLMAIVNGHYPVAAELIDRGADPNIADGHGRSPLIAAVLLRNIQWSQGPGPQLPQREHMAMIRALVAAGADVNAATTEKIPHRGSFDMRWSDLVGATSFLFAAQHGDVELMRFLLEHGADPRTETEEGENALLLLAGVGWPLGQGYLRPEREIMEALALLVEELGMDVNVATPEMGVTPAMAAAYKGTNDVLEYLVSRGARLDAADAEGRSVLNWSQGVVVTLAQPPRLQPHTEALILELMEREGLTAMATP